MKSKGTFWGIVFIIIGLFVLAESYFHLNLTIDNLWPLFILVPGLAFEISYFVYRGEPGLLVPGGILSIIGLLFIFETATNWAYSKYTWPVYILAPAVGLFQLYIHGGREKGLLIPVSILTAIALFSFFSMSLSWPITKLIFGSALIILGVYYLFKGYKKNK